MSITDEAVKIVKSFKPFDIKTEIKNPTINYQSPTNNFYFKSIKIDMSQFNLMIEAISNKIVEQIEEHTLKKIASDKDAS